VAESFRTLRTILFIKLNIDSSKVILVTSSMPGEGKSFVSANLSASIASMGYKTVVIDCDLRKCTLHQKFNIDNSIGLSSYLVNKALIDDILIETQVPNLSFIPAGPLFPNPAELFKSEIADKLFSYLKSTFDYVIIDTPPLGAVADSYLLMKYATHSLIVSRQNYTRKDIFSDVLNGLESNNLHKFDIIMNDLNFKKSSYGQHYGKYYSEEKVKEKGFKKSLKK
jgi:tyrosine-protein kinase Etk/Wzc